MERETSQIAYDQIEAEGLLRHMRWVVYKHLFHCGPLTAVELTNDLKRPGEVSPSYHKRLSELERLGAVRTVGRRDCSITGREAELWDVTPDLPSGDLKPAPGASPGRRQIRAALDELGAFIDGRASENLLTVLTWLEKKTTNCDAVVATLKTCASCKHSADYDGETMCLWHFGPRDDNDFCSKWEKPCTEEK